MARDRIALIGCGAIGRMLLAQLGDQVAALIVRPERVAALRAQIPDTVRICADVAAALATRPTLFVECAGHSGLRAHAPAALGAGVDLLVASVGALADGALEEELHHAAQRSGAAILIPAGALGGLDALGAAQRGGLEDVEYTSIKPVRAWKGTAAEQMAALDAIDRPTVFFTGNAREAAQRFPQNANVAAAVALAGLGFEHTRVLLTADPAAAGNRHLIRARGAFGTIEVAIEGRTLPDNPKTSMLAPLSLLRAIAARGAALRIV